MNQHDDDLLPVHPRTGLTAIGLRRNGAPIWPVLGGAPDDDPDPTDGDPDGDPDNEDEDEDEEELKPAGVKALAAEKEKRRAATARARQAETDLAAAKAELAKLKPGDKDKDKVDVETIRQQERDAAKAETLLERALDKVETRAARQFADPEDARSLLERRAKEFVDDGEIDVDAIDAALKELLEKKPHLAATATKRFAGGADGGARKGSTGVKQLTAQDVKRMSPQQIVEARNKGQLDDFMSS